MRLGVKVTATELRGALGHNQGENYTPSQIPRRRIKKIEKKRDYVTLTNSLLSSCFNTSGLTIRYHTGPVHLPNTRVSNYVFAFSFSIMYFEITCFPTISLLAMTLNTFSTEE